VCQPLAGGCPVSTLCIDILREVLSSTPCKTHRALQPLIALPWFNPGGQAAVRGGGACPTSPFPGTPADSRPSPATRGRCAAARADSAATARGQRDPLASAGYPPSRLPLRHGRPSRHSQALGAVGHCRRRPWPRTRVGEQPVLVPCGREEGQGRCRHDGFIGGRGAGHTGRNVEPAVPRQQVST